MKKFEKAEMQVIRFGTFIATSSCPSDTGLCNWDHCETHDPCLGNIMASSSY